MKVSVPDDDDGHPWWTGRDDGRHRCSALIQSHYYDAGPIRCSITAQEGRDVCRIHDPVFVLLKRISYPRRVAAPYEQSQLLPRTPIEIAELVNFLRFVDDGVLRKPDLSGYSIEMSSRT